MLEQYAKYTTISVEDLEDGTYVIMALRNVKTLL